MGKIADYAYVALPILVARAESGQRMTYRDLGSAIDTSPYYVVPKVLGHIRDVLLPADVPMLTSIVVNAKGIPGRSWLPNGTSQLSDAEYRSRAQTEQQAVFDFNGWHQVIDRVVQDRNGV